jgi:hypothetical protein
LDEGRTKNRTKLYGMLLRKSLLALYLFFSIFSLLNLLNHFRRGGMEFDAMQKSGGLVNGQEP